MVAISVLFPVYNTNSAHLKIAIDSILNQSYTDFELIIYNDASTDPSVENIVKTYKDARIKYICGEKNLGISKVRNKLIDLSKGEYLAVMDHDDICRPDRFEKQINFMNTNPDIGICGTFYRKFGVLLKNKTVKPPQSHKEIRTSLFFKNVIHHPTSMIRRSIIVNNNFSYDTNYTSVNDRKLFMDIMNVSKGHNLNHVLYKYRLHKNMTSKVQREKIVNEQKILRQDFLKRMGASLTPEKEKILNDYVLKGRARIKTPATLVQVEAVLQDLITANNKSLYFDKETFENLCAQYLIKRCANAAFYGQISSYSLLRKTAIPLTNIKKPAFLKIMNLLKRA